MRAAQKSDIKVLLLDHGALLPQSSLTLVDWRMTMLDLVRAVRHPRALARNLRNRLIHDIRSGDLIAVPTNLCSDVFAFSFGDPAGWHFLVDTVEPVCEAFENGRYGEMFATIGARSDCIRSHKDKRTLARDIRSLIERRENGTIGEVLDILKETHHPRLPDKVKRTETELANASQEEIEESRTLSQINKLRVIPYTELISLALFIKERTPFSTKHGVKGAQFENVLVVLGRGWNHYNWNKFLEWFPNQFPASKSDFYERNRNLFYVVCSRPKKRLALLFTQELSEEALDTLRSWFGKENVSPLMLN